MNFKVKATMLSVAISLFVSICHAQNFAPATNYGTGSLPDGSAAADFNHDGNVDIIVANGGDTTLSLLLGNGDGTLGPASTIQIGYRPISVATGDFNGDGNIDVAVCGIPLSPVFTILFGNGDGTFRAPVNVTIPGQPAPGITGLFVFPEIAVADLNLDKKLDIVVATASGAAAFLNDGSGNFTFSGSAAAGQIIQNIALADFNNDGIPDIVFMTSGNGAPVTAPNTFLSLGNGDGTFKPASTIPLTTQNPDGIAVADLNRDGLLDVIVDDDGPPGAVGSGSIQIALQRSGGSFVHVGTLGQFNPTGVIAVDFDGDGNVDIAAAETINGQDLLDVFPGRGDGSFFAPAQFPVAAGVGHPIAAHLTNTVAFDAITSGISANQISVLVNHGANTLSLASSLNPSGIAQPVTLKAFIQPKFTGSGTFSGSLIFADGTKTLGTAPVDFSGTGSLTTTFASPGKHSLLAVFGGNSSFVGGSSASLVQTVNKGVPTVSLSSALNPSSFGQSVSFNINVAGVSGAPTATGVANLMDGTSIILSGTLDQAGNLALSTASLSVGNHSLTAQYTGDSNYQSANSPVLNQAVGKGASTTKLIGSPNPSSFGQSVDFTATVTAAAGSGTPAGTVNFSDGSTSLGSSPLDANGQATVKATSLAAGTHNVTATYAGDTNFSNSVGSFSQTVTKGASTTALAGSPNPSTFGQNVTLTATVTAQSVTATPTGTVTFSDGTTSLGTASVDALGNASLSVASLNVGSHSIVASYAGDSNFVSSASAPLSQVVNKASSTAILTTGPNPGVFGQGITLTATVAATGGVPSTPSGTVTFSDGTTTLGTSQLDKTGKAAFTISSLSVGSHPLTAAYAGDGNFQPSLSSTTTQTVNKSVTTTTVVIAPNPSSFGQSVSLNASVTAAGGGSGIPSGSVSFTDGSATLGMVTLDNSGKATLTLSSLSTGTHSVSASYSGDGNFLTSASPAITQTVNKSGSTTGLTSSPNPSSFGQTVTLEVTVNSASGSGTLSGTINFTEGSNPLGSAILDNTGKATFTTGALPVGSHILTAAYAGDGNFQGSTSAAATQVVNKSASAIALATSLASSSFGQSVTFTATITDAANGSGIPSGAVTFMDGTIGLGTAIVDNTGKAPLTISTLAVGTHSISASYAGDNNFSNSSSATLQQTVNKSATSTTLTASPNPSVFGQPVVLNVAVAASGGSGIPSGTVAISDGSSSLGTASLDGKGQATFTVSSLAIGSHNITASYAGDGNFNPSSASGSSAVAQVVSQSPTTSTVSSSANSSVFGQVVTFTAVVSASGGGGGVPPGTVTFMDGAISLGKATLDNTGTATFITSGLAVGTHSVSVAYAGSTNHLASNSSTLSQSVAKNSVSVSLMSAPNPSSVGQAVTFTVGVLPSSPGGGGPGGATPTGAITFSDGGSILGTATLDSSGSVTFTITTLKPGSHTITATFGGDANFSEGSSIANTQVVNKAATQTRLTSSMNPSTNASTITLSVTLTATSGAPSGSVAFFDGGMQLGSSPLDGAGTAIFSVSNLALGAHVLGASYSGDSNFAGSQSSVTETVVDSHSAVLLTSSANPQVVTKAVTLMATVSSSLGGQATGGTVTFMNGQTFLATLPVVNSTASFTTQSLPVGNNQILAFYRAGTAAGPFDGSGTLVESINEATPVVVIGGDDQDFSISLTSAQAQVKTGDTFTTQVALVPIHGLTGLVTTICTGVPEGSTCTITPNSATFDGKTPLTTTLVITTTGAVLASNRPPTGQHPLRRQNLELLQYLPIAIGCFLVPGLTKKRNRVITVVFLASTLIGCGGTKFQQRPLHESTPPGAYTVNIQAVSGTLAHSAQLQLTIQ